MKKIKILNFELQPQMGGIENFLVNVYKNINKKKYQIDFVTTAQDPLKLPYIDDLKHTKIYTISKPYNLIRYMNDVNKILNNGYDIVHFHKNSAANIIPIFLAKNNNNVSKIIIHSHNTNPSQKNKMTLLLHYCNKRYLKRAGNQFLACSENAGKWLFPKDSSFTIVKDGINARKFVFSKKMREIIRQKYQIGKKDLVLGYVGRFTTQKNLPFLMEIFRNVLFKHNNSYLFLIGNGPKMNDLKKYAKKLAIDKNVIFTGEKSDTQDFLSAMDVFIMPSLYEGLAISAIEAQASGLKAFVSNRLPEEAKISSNIVTFSLKETPSKISQLILNDSFHGLRVESAQDRIKQNEVIAKNYDISQTVRDLDEIYSDLVKE